MTSDDLASGVVRAGVVAVAIVALAAAIAAGMGAAAGVLAGGAVALGNFRWLVRDASRLTATAGAGSAVRLLPLGLRHLTALASLAVLIGSGWSHPLAVAAGLAVLPPVLVVQGLRAGAR
jgi:hypothetical protein